jgi:tRNA threonylcarbamoyladenosine biosynthesis protein TsaE
MNERFGEGDRARIAKQILDQVPPEEKGATVIGISGDLGAGKTTLTSAIGEILGVSETIQSPTFVIAKRYRTTHPLFQSLVHMDAYRIDSIDELGPLGWDALCKEDKTLVVVEWPEKIKAALPSRTHLFSIAHDGDHRVISHG